MKASVKSLKSKYVLFIISIICVIALQVILEYWFDQETMFSLVLSAGALLIIVLQFVYIFLPSVKRLSSVNQKLVRLRKSLEQRERQYREMVEGATDNIYELNSNGEFSFVNEIMLRMSGYSHEELIGRSYLTLIHPDDRGYAAKFYRDQLKAGHETTYLEFRMLGKQGQTYWIGQNVRYFYEDRWVEKVRVVARDITQGRQAQLALQKLKEEAEQTTLAKSQFLSMMSHEIRTPMNAIIGLSNLLTDSELTVEQRENVHLLRFSSENLLAIINDILDFSKIEAQKVILETIDFDLYKLVNQTINIHRINATEKGVQIVLHLDETIPRFVKGDPVRLSQVMNNLLSNAIKFTAEGEVKVDVLSVSRSEQAITFRLRVTDPGIGIPPDKLATIFESFSQAEDATTRKYGGTGLGLAITKKLIELMGGQIMVESTPGTGTVFTTTLTLPVGTSQLLSESTESETISLPEGAHILVAEDNTMNQLVLISFLRKWNLESSIAVNGKEALSLITHKTFDLVLMDLQMPEMSGYEVTEHIRAMEDEYFQRIPIIALTASAMSEVKGRVLASGMNDFLSKPFQPHELKRLLARYLRKDASKPVHDYHDAIDSTVSGEEAFHDELLHAALDNLIELEAAFQQSTALNDPMPFRAAAHKCRMTLTFLDDTNLEGVVTQLVSQMKVSTLQDVSPDLRFKFLGAIKAATTLLRTQLV